MEVVRSIGAQTGARGLSSTSAIPPAPKRPYPFDKTLYRQCHKVENLFATLKDWRRTATR